MQATINNVCQYNVAVLLIPSVQLFNILNDIPYSLAQQQYDLASNVPISDSILVIFQRSTLL